MRNAAFIIVALSLLMTTACEQEIADKTNHSANQSHSTLFAFGTLIDVTLYDVKTPLANKVFLQLESDFQQYHHNWSPWENGALFKLNKQLEQNKSAIVENELRPLIQQAIILSQQSNETFNPTIGNLINLWQFNKHNEPEIKPPSAIAIKSLVKQAPSVTNLTLQDNNLRSNNKHVQFNLGAFAKGYGIQLALNKLKKMGVKNAIINAGGDLGAIGSHGTRPWRIGIRSPRNEDVIASVDIHSGENVFTSGDYERVYFYKDQRYHHILNPKTGYPTEGFSSVTVIHDDAGVADAAATALMVAGPKNWFKIAKSMELQNVMLIGENGEILLSPTMADRIQLTNRKIADIKLSEAL